MSLPADLRAAYERRRFCDAALQTLPLLLLPLLVVALVPGPAVPMLVGTCWMLVFGIARWQGRSWGQGALLGLAGGLIAALPALGMSATGLGCVGGSCGWWCMTLCGSAGVVGGIFVGLRAGDMRSFVTGATVMVLAGVLGCWPMGVGMAGGTVVAIVMAMMCGCGVRLGRTYR